MRSENLQIHLDQPYSRQFPSAHLFAPDDRILGNVIFSHSSDENVDSIAIEFKGKLRTSTRVGAGDNRRTIYYHFMLFRVRLVLFRGPFKMRASTYTYPFSFIFPSGFVRGVEDFHRVDDRFDNSLGPLPLPPSFSDTGQASGNAEIYYKLTTSIPRTFGNWKDVLPLQFTQPRTESFPHPQPKMTQDPSQYHINYRLTNEGIPRPLGKRESFKNLFHSYDETITMNYYLLVEAPTSIVIGQAYTLTITLKSKDVLNTPSTPQYSNSKTSYQNQNPAPESKLKSLELIAN